MPFIFSKVFKLIFSLLSIFKTNGEKNLSEFESILKEIQLELDSISK